MRKIVAVLSFLLVTGLIGCIGSVFDNSTVAMRSTPIPVSGWVPVPNGWPRPTQSIALQANSVTIATSAVSSTASPNVVGAYDWYPINFGSVVVPNANWTLLSTGKYQTILRASTTSYNGASSFYYYFRWFQSSADAECFANTINDGNSIEGAPCNNVPLARITTL